MTSFKLFPSGYPTKTLNAFTPMRSTRFANLALLSLFAVTKYIHFIHPVVTFSLLGPNTPRHPVLGTPWVYFSLHRDRPTFAFIKQHKTRKGKR